jgi:DNA-binding SARP family transcriptional activator/tetratricopeptide (TPR) repeat protein
VEFRILGPLEVSKAGRTIDIGVGRQPALLGVLLLHNGEVVSTERLIDELWGDRPPRSAAKAVQGYVSGLRKVLGAAAIVTKARGYVVQAGPAQLDLAQFERLVAEAREQRPRDPRRASELLAEALALWRGSPLEGVVLESEARNEIQRLAERRTIALEQRIEARLAIGAHVDLVPELQKLVGSHPYRESLRAHLMLALYRSGRQSEALACYREGRRLLADELGLEPSQTLRDLEGKMLAQAAELDMPVGPAPESPVAAAQPAPEQATAGIAARRATTLAGRDIGSRRIVTVLAAGATAHDPEVLHEVLEGCAGVIERYGASLERYVGDTVVGLFGLTSSSEDDAVLAARAALEIAAAGAVQVGVESGEVFVTSDRRRGAIVATGAAIVAAGELARDATAGCVLLGSHVREALGTRATVEAGGLLLALPSEAPEKASDGPFVGRDRELTVLRTATAQVCEGSGAQLVTIVGAPGVGKSRLARELLAELRDEATVLVGRCSSHGEGGHFGALAEIVRGLDEDPVRRTEELLEGDAQAARAVLGAVSLAREPVQLEEAFWGMHKLLSRLARDRPLVIVVEDIHWAEPSLLDLIDHVVTFSSRSPLLIVCLTRPDLLDVRPAWAAPQPGRSLLVLDPLSQAATLELVGQLGAGELAPRIVEMAEGNPLFAEQLVAVADDPNATLPASIQAVLMARIDRLAPDERFVLQHAAVEGRTFHTGALMALMGEDAHRVLPSALVALGRKGLLRGDRPRFADEEAFRFDHALIREAAYAALPKRLRAELHERLAEWLELRADVPDEVIGHHLEQACRLPAELGPVGARERALGARAAEHFAGAARAALGRGDPSAAGELLERAIALLETREPARSALLTDLGVALFEAGRLADADVALDEALRQARDPRLAARAKVERRFVALGSEANCATAEARRVADAALAVFEEHGDDRGECRARCLQAMVSWIEGHVAAADRAWERAAELAERSGDERELLDILGWRASATVIGPTPLEAALRLCGEIRERAAGNPVWLAVTLHPLAALHAMAGSFETARRLVHDANEVLRELGRMQSAVSHHEALVELLAGRPARAEERLREGYDRLAELGEGALLATTAAMLAQAVFAQGRPEEAEGLCDVAARTTPSDDVITHVVWRGVRAKLLAARGEAAAAQALAGEAVAAVERTDLLMHHGDALLDLAEVYRLGGRMADAGDAARAAELLCERKGNVVGARRARSMLAERTGGE